jgi:hypothetical protein
MSEPTLEDRKERKPCTCGHPLIDHCDDGAQGYCIHEGCDCDRYEAQS